MQPRTWTDTELQAAVTVSRNLSQVLVSLGLQIAGGSAATLRKHIRRLGLSTDHFTGSARLSGELHPSATSNTAMFTENSAVTRSSIRKRLVRENILPYRCDICQNTGQHFGQPLVLQLDHVNGVKNDNRLENLRWLCPNCHSQTPTFAGRNLSKRTSSSRPRDATCVICGNPAYTGRTFCSNKCSGVSKRKISWPEYSELKELVALLGYCGTGTLLGVSDVAVHKRLKLAEKESNLQSRGSEPRA